MKSSRLIYQVLIQVFVLFLIASCSPMSTHPPALTDNPPPPIATSTVRPTPKNTATLRPTRTTALLPTPDGAGLVPLSFRVEFFTPYDDLSPGDYAVMPLYYDSDTKTSDDFYSLSLDGTGKKKLFSVATSEDKRVSGPGTMITDDGKVIFLHWVSDSENKSGLLEINLMTQKLQQFDMGCPNATPYIHGPYISTGDAPYLAYTCDERNRIWHFVSTETWEISSQAFPQPSGLYKTNDIFFLNEELAIISDDFPYSKADVKCLFNLETGEKECLKDVPNWWNPVSEVSSDGQNVVVWVPQGGAEDNGYGGIISLSCIENPEMDNCEPMKISTPKDVPFWSFGSPREKLWAPDGEKIIGQFNLDDFVTVKLWIYDFPSGQTRLVGSYPVLELRGGWDNKSENVIATTWTLNGILNWQINTDTGKMKRIDEGLTGKKDPESYPVIGIIGK